MVAQADDAVFRPVRTGNPFEETVERLLQAIKLGVVAPGERLPAERDLATRLNVSRVTLREAIHALTEAGYVESRRGRYGGTFVNEQLPKPRRTPARRIARELGDGLEDALTLRGALETGAAEAAAARELSVAEIDHLQRCLADTSAANLTDYRRFDSRLHLAIAEVTGSPSLTSAVADARMRLNELLDAIPLLSRNITHSNEQHEAIIQAILEGDQAAARAAMSEHLSGTATLLHGFLT
ncbi:FadR family transcriptional regulator [Kribbella sandramycini]|uniref:FadR family transcriptional regulator n=1 Tax=Kribbella sandramycini TaxID=60450 RepID=A0A7Y4P321_9ACTN|nr:FCD domain-containing protein [Kribbella sandramycini]MBB6566891.1 DNA-binding FadR family transcriptional regulator [Kribbella sandramycini]NOL44613.1 FadR family transcriptional regulator [Kribbella sandramycini]